MIDLLKLKDKSYSEWVNYNLTPRDIEELEELCYSYGTCLPLAEFYNDIKFNSSLNFDKHQAYKDLLYLVQYIQELEYLERLVKEELQPRITLKKDKLHFDEDKSFDIYWVKSSGFLMDNVGHCERLKELFKEEK